MLLACFRWPSCGNSFHRAFNADGEQQERYTLAIRRQRLMSVLGSVGCHLSMLVALLRRISVSVLLCIPFHFVLLTKEHHLSAGIRAAITMFFPSRESFCYKVILRKNSLSCQAAANLVTETVVPSTMKVTSS